MNLSCSEAIRLGSMLKPQGEGTASAEPGALATCALGAASEAIGFKRSWVNLSDAWPILDLEIQCPAGFWKGTKGKLIQVIYRLNDGAGWTREQIAGFVQGIEDRMVTEPIPAKESEEVNA